MKQTKLWLTTIATILCCLSASAHDFEVDGIYYKITYSTDLTVEVTYQGSSYSSYSNEYSGAVTIPSTVTYNNKTYSVTSIGNNAFYYCSALTSITIPESVTSIGSSAFSNCSSLTTITIPEGVTSIGNYAFYYCSALTSITIPESVTSIGSSAFSNCSSLTTITIPEGVTSIGNSAFSGCSSLTTITIPEGVTSIGNSAFSDCSSLTTITIPEGVTSIGNSAFSDCSSLTSITIPEGVMSIGSCAFGYCNSLTSIILPESLTSIGSRAFEDCNSLTSIIIPEGVSRIGWETFFGCSRLTSITIPMSVKNIDADAFQRCNSLTDIHIVNIESWLNIEYEESSYSRPCRQAGNMNLYIDNILLTEIEIPLTVTSIPTAAFSNCKSLVSITIPESVTEIGQSAFSGCSSLTTVSFQENSNLMSIGAYAFYDCSSLTDITIPENSQLTSIGICAFRDCSNLTSITIPNGVTSIGNSMFCDCSSLTSISVPQNVTEIGDHAFSGCSNLTTVSFQENSNLMSIGAYAFYDCSSLTDITIPENSQLTSIGICAFRDCSSLTSITIPEGITSIGDDAFYGCSNITSVIIPQNVTEIGKYAFFNCSSLASITLPESITNIKEYTFYGCNSLAAINIPKNVEWIGDYAFSGCGLTDIQISSIESWLKIRYVSDAILYPENYSSHPNYLSSNMNLYVEDTLLTEVDIPSTITSVPNYAFKGCCSITSVNIPESVTEIGHGAFKDCSSLTSVKISDSSNLTIFGKETFRNCGSLTSILIPGGVTDIGERMFSSCSSLVSILLSEGITNIGEYAFSECSNLTSITIPNSVERIGNSAFFSCSNLTTVNISGNSKLTNIADYAFSYCKGLTSFTIPKNIDRIGTYAFRDCSRLYTIINYSDKYISAGSHNYGDLSFYAKRVLNGNSLMTVGDFQFYTSGNTHYLANYTGYDEEIILPDSYNGENYRVDAYTFYYNDIKSLTISSGVLSIGEKAFNNPKKVIWLTNTPPSNYTNAKGSINYVSNEQYTNLSNAKVYPYLSSMFEMDGVKYVPVSPSDRTCHAIDCAYDSTAATINVGETASFKGVAMTVTEVMPYTFYGNSHIKEVAVSHIGNIGYYAFYNCDSVQHVVVANRGDIGDQAFYDCDGLVTAEVYSQGRIYGQAFYDCDNIEVADISNQGYIGEKAFKQCLKLSEIKLHDGITEIKNEAFSSCESLERIEIPSTVSYIGQQVFYACDSLVSITVDKSNATYDSRDNSNAIMESSSNKLIVGCNATVVPESVTAIGDYAFYGCGNLSSLSLSENITTLGNYAFRECKSLKEVVIPNSVKSVGAYCYYNCSSLNNVMLGGVSSIGDYAFSGCSSLTDIVLPENLLTVGNYVFSGCSKLTNVIIEDRTQALALGSNGYSPLFANCPLDSVYIGGKITYNTSSSKGYSPFYRNTSLRTVVISDREELIHDNEFYGCTNLQNVTVGNGVSRIGNYAFSGCSNLDGFSFGSNMESIGTEAFSDCTNLTTITSHAIIPPTCNAQALDDINKWSCVLRVPSGYAETYQAADQWKEFFFVEDVIEVKKYALTFIVDGEVYYTDSLAHKKTIPYVSKPHKKGYTFSGWDKTFTKMPAGDVVINGTFTINTYRVNYVVDGVTYHTDEVTYGDPIVLAEEPTKEGYTFSGWSEAPEVMPAYDVTVRGSFIANKYLVTFKIGDEIIISDSLECGSVILVPEVPEKEGYTFNGWGKVAETVPASDVTYEGSYSVNSYLLTYTVDGETVQSDSIVYGAIIALIDEPTKEGHSFSGWSEAPETMPAGDVTISGTFTANKYLVTFKIGDEVIAADSLEYGAAIVAPEAPEREGYTFSGWGEVAAVVPANDLIYEGSYTVNSYLLTYTVDGETVQSDSIVYGAIIALIDEPTKEGHTFSGWSEAPETMPAEDLTISGTFTVNTYKVYYYVSEELVHTAEVAYGEAIPEYTHEATGEGDVFEGWVGETYETMPAHDVTYVANITNGIEQSAISNHKSEMIFDLMGRKVTDTENLKGGVYIINGRKVVINVNDERLTKTTVIIR